ncbi:PRC-barrel domain-containing protein [Phormidium tenue FACHB-886]|nr:PRC-barrel domain-containing protein [Phormidium tenue FACHB-886]
MTEQFCLRADLIGTQVITRNTGKRLGVVSQFWVDVDRREVVVIGIRQNMLSGVLSQEQQTLLLKSVHQIGDVILVDDDSVLDDDISLDSYSNLVNSEVITETGEQLGKVRGFKFEVNTGRVEAITIASFGLPQIPDQLISTYELSMDEVVSSGPDRLIVFEGAEEKLNQLSVGLLERLGIGKPPWERDEEGAYMTPAATTNQLPSGLKTPVEPMRAKIPVAQETWDDDNWQEAPPRQQAKVMRQEEPVPEPESNWNDRSDYEDVEYEEIPEPAYVEPKYAADEEVTQDAWADDDNPKPYRAPQVNLPERKRVVEYEEETDY